MSAGDYLVGLAFFAAMLVAVLAGAAILLRRRLPQLTGSTAVLAYALIATLGVLGVHLLPAALGILTRGTVVACAVLALAAVWRLVPARAGVAPSPPPEPAAASGRLSWLLVGAGVAGFAAHALAVARGDFTQATQSIDMLNFHLPGIARWIQTGSIWQIDEFLPEA